MIVVTSGLHSRGASDGRRSVGIKSVACKRRDLHTAIARVAWPAAAAGYFAAMSELQPDVREYVHV